MSLLRIGTRRSELALWQSGHVKRRLEEAWPGLEVELVEIVTMGDRIQDRPLASIGGKALFVKEIEQRLIDQEIDLAVHSMKDVPPEVPEGLGLIATTRREDPTDALVTRVPDVVDGPGALPEGASVGTGSMRRACQMLAFRPDLRIVPIRGNVDTRLRKLDELALDAVILASAALDRLGLSSRIARRLSPDLCLPAVGQGALAIEARLDDERVRRLMTPLNDVETELCVLAERGFLRRLEGSCQVPIAGHAERLGDDIYLRGLIGLPDGTRIVRGERRGDPSGAWDLGVALAEDLLARGADEVIAALGLAGQPK